MYIIIDEDGQSFTGEDIQELIKIVKEDGYGPMNYWSIYEAVELQVEESYTVKPKQTVKPATAKPAAKKAAPKK